ncbi:hypothetical protein WA158_005347 [Blastocystis sp. Blastoise]
MVQGDLILVQERVDQMKQDICLYEELLKDIIGVFSSFLSFASHSSTSISREVSRITKNMSIKEFEQKQQEISKDTTKVNTFEGKGCKRKFKEEFDEENLMDLIRFTNNGPVFFLSKKAIDTIPGSYIHEQSDPELRTNDGTIYLDYKGNDVFVYYLLDYLNGGTIDFSKFNYDELLNFVDLFEFCQLPLPKELINCRQRRDTKFVKYDKSRSVTIYINGKIYKQPGFGFNDVIEKFDNLIIIMVM